MTGKLPSHHGLPIEPLAQLFRNVFTSYKFFWFLAILENLTQEEGQTIGYRQLFATMVAKVWYPVHYFKLSFGKRDMLSDKAMEILQHDPEGFSIDMAPGKLMKLLQQHPDREISAMLFHFQKEVPYRFLTAWLGSGKEASLSSLEKTIEKRSQTFEKDCLYRLNYGEERSITINPKWQAYLFTHRSILQEYTYWNLLLYLQRRNPNVPDIASKLVKPIKRRSLKAQRDLWDYYLDIQGPIQCIYTGKLMHRGEYDLDHFIPWSFLPNDQLWNLIPGNPAVNSSKSNNLPDLDYYLPEFARTQQKALKVFFEQGKSKLLEDYTELRLEPQELVKLSVEAFTERYRETMSPLVQIAANSGFPKNWKWTPR